MTRYVNLPALVLLFVSAAASPDSAVAQTYRQIGRGAKMSETQFSDALLKFRDDLKDPAPSEDLETFVGLLGNVESPAIGPVKSENFNLFENQAAAFRMVLDLHLTETLPADQLGKHPSADLYPGPVPDRAKRISKEVTVDLNTIGWSSTGLYAPAGELVEVTIPENLKQHGLRIRIGVQDAALKPDAHQIYRRFPKVMREFPLTAETTSCCNALGGLIYVRLPWPEADRARPLLINRTDIYGTIEGYERPEPEEVTIEFKGVVEAPRYVHGETDPREWRQHQRSLPAPWAEIGSDKIVFAIPSEAIRNFDTPDLMMDKWDEVLDSMAELSGRPKTRVMPIHMAFDTHIAVGLAYCSTWVYVPDEWFQQILNAEPFWGPLHELGHVHQYKTWTFQNTTEVTVNLFTLYSLEKAHGVKSDHRGPRWIAEHVIPWFDLPEAERNWMNNRRALWERLGMYQVLVEEFGWEPIREVLLEYRNLPLSEHPQTPEDCGGDFMYRMSVKTNRDLAPFFAAWGVQLSQSYVDKSSEFEVFRSTYLEQIMIQARGR